MKRFCIAAVVLAGAAGFARAELVERVVARVNDRIITESDLDYRVAHTRVDPSAHVDPLQVRLSALEQLIQQKLVDDKADALNIQIAPEEVADAVDRVKQQYGLSSDEQFDRALEANGVTRDALREQLRETLLTNKLLAREVPINLTDDALRTEYERLKEDHYAIPERAHVSEILVRFDPGSEESLSAARKKIEEASRRIAAGTPFADVARDFSEGPAREKGGDLGIVSKGDLTPELDRAIFGPSKPLEAVQTRDALYLLSVTDHQPVSYRPFDEVKDEIRTKMSEEIYEKKFSEYLKGLRKASFVKIFDEDLAKADQAIQNQAPPS
jgi:parvulin-like peptidyl-prolyl isomerase